MTLAFFDFYPIITCSDTFGDVLDSASFYFLLYERSYLLVLMGFFILSLTLFPRLFERKNMIYSVALTLVMMLMLGVVEKSYLPMKLSDIWMKTAYNFVVICLGYFMFFFIPYFTKKHHKSNTNFAKFRALPIYHQVTFLALFLVSSCSFGHMSYLPIVLIMFLYGILLSYKSQKLTPKDLLFQWSDYYPLVLVILLGIGLSFIKVSTVVCHTPWLCEYFNCYGIR